MKILSENPKIEIYNDDLIYNVDCAILNEWVFTKDTNKHQAI